MVNRRGSSVIDDTINSVIDRARKESPEYKEQQQLLHYVETSNARIRDLEVQIQELQDGLVTARAMLTSLLNDKRRAIAPGVDLQDDGLIHINEAASVKALPQPNTLRQWIRNGRLTEYVADGIPFHYKRQGVRSKIYIHVEQILKDLQSLKSS